MWFKWLLIGLFAASMLLTVRDVDKPRTPNNGTVSALIVLIDALLIVGILYYWK